MDGHSSLIKPSLVSLEPLPNVEAVELLKRYLAMAEKGGLNAVAVVACLGDGGVSTDWDNEGWTHKFTLVGGLESMKQRVLEGE